MKPTGILNEAFASPTEKFLNMEEAFKYLKWKDNFKKNYALEQGYNYLEIPYWKVKDDSYKELINNKIKELY